MKGCIESWNGLVERRRTHYIFRLVFKNISALPEESEGPDAAGVADTCFPVTA